MNKLIDIFTKNLDNGNYLLIVLIVFIVLSFKFEKIFKSFDNMKKNKLNFLIDITKKDFLDNTTKENVYETINNDIFKVTTGIQTNKYMREKIINLYNNYKGEISLYDIKKSIPFLKIKNDSINIKLTKFDYYFSYIFSLIFGIFSLWLGLILITFFSLVADTTNTSIHLNVTAIIMGIGLIIMSFPILKDTLAYKAARKIKEIIEES